MARAYMAARHPRVLYVDLGDPDDFAHEGDYGSYLDAAHYADAMFRDVWEEQFAATLGALLGLKFAAPHAVAPGISLR